ncbi:hypothetical protein DL546_007903 [Coniochaeta pulveracea]|uniref:Uncharacterized protein n=1 Tax=Coniochaeta pulveracea TaxID=177199 RepID=A0A420YJH8_9PEZI|nr:hypothetical protein DL546_007903 [Coniochaeta pulveracea]
MHKELLTTASRFCMGLRHLRIYSVSASCKLRTARVDAVACRVPSRGREQWCVLQTVEVVYDDMRGSTWFTMTFSSNATTRTWETWNSWVGAAAHPALQLQLDNTLVY